MSSTGPYGTATTANVAASGTSTQIFAPGPANSRTVFNDSAAVLYLLFGTTASTTSYTVQIPAGGYYEFPKPIYQGEVDGIWSSAAGNARLTSW